MLNNNININTNKNGEINNEEVSLKSLLLNQYQSNITNNHNNNNNCNNTDDIDNNNKYVNSNNNIINNVNNTNTNTNNTTTSTLTSCSINVNKIELRGSSNAIFINNSKQFQEGLNNILNSSGDKNFLKHGSNNIITDPIELQLYNQQRQDEISNEIVENDDIIGYNEENEDNFFNDGIEPTLTHMTDIDFQLQSSQNNNSNNFEDTDSSSDESENLDEILVYSEDIESEKEKRRERLITSPPSFDPHTLYSMSQSLLNCSLNNNNNNSNNNINNNNNNTNINVNITSSSPTKNNNSNLINQPYNPLPSTSIAVSDNYQFLPIPQHHSSSTTPSIKNSIGSSTNSIGSVGSSTELSNIFHATSPPNRGNRSMTLDNVNLHSGGISPNINGGKQQQHTIRKSADDLNQSNNNNNRPINHSTYSSSPPPLSTSTTFKQQALNKQTLEKLSLSRKEIYELIEKKERMIEKQSLINEGYSENADSFENLQEEIIRINERITVLESTINTLSNGSSISPRMNGNSVSSTNSNTTNSTTATSTSLTNSLRKFSQELKIQLRPLDLRSELYSCINTSPRGSCNHGSHIGSCSSNCNNSTSNINNTSITTSGVIGNSASSTSFKSSSSNRNSPVPFFEMDGETEQQFDKINSEQFESMIELIEENQLYFKPIEFKDIKLLEKLETTSVNNNIWQIEYKSMQFVLKQPKDQDVEKNLEKRKQLFNYNNNSGDQTTWSKYSKIKSKNCNLLIGWCGDSIIYESFKSMNQLYDLLHKDMLRIEMPLFMKIGKEIANVLSTLHSNGVIHGNLTSKSIYIDKHQVVKVSFPKLNATDLNNPSIEPRYMAPEITKMEADQISSSIDVYSYAFILLEMLTNIIPFKKFNNISVAAKTAYENLRPKIPNTSPLIIRKLINRCWAPSPADRPTFDEIIKLFDHLEGKLFFSSPGVLWSLNNQEEIDREILKRQKFLEITEFLSGKNEIKFDEVIICEKIGQGSFANVYKGYIYSGFSVAVKILKNESLAHDEKFIKEVSSLIKSRHPNIVTFIACCVDKLCIITEYLSGGSLYDAIHSEKVKLNPQMMFKMIHDIALGMQHLHSINMVHRDLTSKNILLDEFKNIKIADFGLATSLNDDMTSFGICNPRWRAPELTKGLTYTEKVDVYSFGLIVYEIISGNVPFDGVDGVAAAGFAAFENQRPEISTDCPLYLKNLIEKCWSNDPNLRPSFTEIIAILEIIKPKFIKQLNFLNDLFQNPDDDSSTLYTYI